MLEDGLFALLSQDASLIALQGARVYPVLLPEGSTLPATTYQGAGGYSEPTLNTSGMQRRRMQLDHIATTARSAWQLRDATRKLLDGFNGALPNGFYIKCLFLQPVDHFDNDSRQFRCAAEYYFFFNLQ